MAGGSSDSSQERKLDQTPTWAVAVVVTAIIIISLALEKLLHRLGEWFTERRKKALFDALEKIKAELMVLGFISLLLTIGQSYIARICIPVKAADTMLPCSLRTDTTKKTEGNQRRLLWDDFFVALSSSRRVLAEEPTSKCGTGKVPLVSTNAIHQLHIFIFFLAVSHVVYSALTMAFGRLKIRGWKEWEKETTSLTYEFSNDPARFRFAHQTSFVRAHRSIWLRYAVSFYAVSFFRQFFRSVRKTDYLTLRHGFIAVHLAPGSKFNFQKYIKRSLEDDFKVVVEISPILWGSAVIFLLVNVHGSYALFWLSILPLIIILAVGTKLQAIIAEMALEIKEKHAVVQGIPLVQLDDQHFWFGHPKLLLYLIHFTLFQNAFQITYFFWIWYEFKLRSCFHEKFYLVIARVVIGVVVQILCSYVTLPLYALVSQMGSHMKKSIFDEQTSKALKRWHQAAKKRGKSGQSPTRTLGVSMSPGASPISSPAHPFYRYKTTGHSSSTKTNSRKGYYSDQDMSDMEGDASPVSQTAVLIDNMDPNGIDSSSREQEHNLEHKLEEKRNEDDFSFVFAKPSANIGTNP
ncbi:MLO-like protein 9 [Tasmannia lanceolata]|uniref:MLO-like protein 9 n=1 Tax=Tasmannia lanceolata TaxID=3420 RepID=UPI00406360CB